MCNLNAMVETSIGSEVYTATPLERYEPRISRRSNGRSTAPKKKAVYHDGVAVDGFEVC